MSILDLFKKDKTEILTSHGTTWTELLSGIITEEYNSDLQFPDSIGIYDEMRKSDATVIAALRAIKNPLLSAKWQIQAGWEETKDKEIADFVSKNLFEKVKFKHFLRESLWFLDFGFYYFEKNFEIVDWKIEWKELSPRVPKAHYLWEIKNKDWVDWHPAWITQQVSRSDEHKIDNFQREIPWEKLILFSFEKEWNNFEWVSILRNAYKHYFYKDLGYKIQSISGERYGVGIPTAQVKSSMNETNKNKLIEFLKNIRSNEQSYWVYTDDVTKFEIMTPNGTGVWSQIQTQIDHHDRKIYDSIHAWFLNLTSWDGGSNALSKDQSSFFMRGLQWTADFFIDTMNEHIKELVDLNYNNTTSYPKLVVSEIGSISMDEAIDSIGTAVEKGMLELNNNDKDAVRAILKLPALPPTDEWDTDLDNVEAELDLEQLEISTLEDLWQIQPQSQDMDEQEQLSEDFEDIELWQPLTEEHKKKISEALLKGKNKAWSYKDVNIVKTQNEFIQDNPEINKYQNDRQKLQSMADKVKESMDNLKNKRSTMSKEQKKKFAKEYAKKIWEMRTERIRLQTEWKKLKAQENQKANSLKAVHREVKSQLRTAKNQERIITRDTKAKERAAAKATKDVERAATKAKKEAERASAKAKREAEKEAKKRNKKLAESDTQPTNREVVFSENITAFEDYLEDQYQKAEDIITEMEHEWQDALEELYDNSDTERVDGVVCLIYDKTKVTAGKNKIQKITDKYTKLLIDSELQKDIFQTALDRANETLNKNDTFFSEEIILAWNGQYHAWKRVNIPAGQIDTFIEGYKSNMQGVLYNENRRVLENITLNYGSEASVDLAQQTAAEISINKNILSLSFITHPRALFKYVIYNEAQAEWFTMFKTIVPTDKIPNVIDRPFGMTASLIFTIQTAAQINKAASVATAWKTAEAVTGLGLHHGSFEYYYPVASAELIEEELIAKAQRDELQQQMDLWKE